MITLTDKPYHNMEFIFKDRLQFCHVEYLDVIINELEFKKSLHNASMSSVDQPVGDGGWDRMLEGRLKYLYRFKGVQYLTHEDIMEKLRQWVKKNKEKTSQS